MNDLPDVYEPTDDDRAAALAQAQRIAADATHLNAGEMAEILTAKIEAAILAEMVMRGRPLNERQ